MCETFGGLDISGVLFCGFGFMHNFSFYIIKWA